MLSLTPMPLSPLYKRGDKKPTLVSPEGEENGERLPPRCTSEVILISIFPVGADFAFFKADTADTAESWIAGKPGRLKANAKGK
jgi:hypothetical protein